MKRKILAQFSIVVFVFGLTGCENEGSAEKAGKKVDEIYKEAEKQVDKAMDAVKENIDEAKE